MIARLPISAPRPLPGETREDYTVRAHRELMAIIPDPAQRNQVVWEACDASFGDPETERAQAVFPPEQFECRRNVCLWHEHETATRDPETGAEIVKKNDIERIKSIVRENNLRIADTDAYSAIVDKHTLPSGKRDPIPPRTIGFAGPFRIGMIGRVSPRFALFGDEHRRRDESHTFRDRPRRSVEVLTLRANGRSYIDPIAALSEAPRLPLPVQYGFDAAEGHREIYEAVAALPGGGNTYIPNETDDDRDEYATGNPNPQPETVDTMTPENITQIIEAIQSTPQFQFLNQLMQQSGEMEPAGGGMGGSAAPVGAGAVGGAQPPPATSAMGQPVPGQPPGMGQPGGMSGKPDESDKFACGPKYGAGSMAPYGGMMPQNQQYMTNRFGAAEGEDEVNREQYQAIVDQNEQLSERYSALESSHRELLEEHAALRRGFAEVRMREADANRRASINELASQYPHFIEPDREFSKCLYSAGSQMDDEQFASHLEELEHYAAKAPVATGMIPQGVFPERSRSVETERYEANLAARTVEVYTQALAAGRKLTHSEAKKLAQEEMGGH